MNSGFVLPNVGPGPELLTLPELEAEFVVFLLHRDFYCSECRQQVRRVKSRYDEFEARDAEVISVLPEDRETAAEWQKQYHLPFPVVADEEKELAERFDQPTRYGLLGKLHDIIGRMPATVVLDLRWSDPMETFAHRGESKTDRPRIDELLAAIDDAAAMGEDTTPAEREAAAEAVADGRDPSVGTDEGAAGEQSTRPGAESAAESPTPGEATAPPETAEPVEAGGADERREPGDAAEPADAEEPVEPTATGDGGAVESQAEPEPAGTAAPLPVPEALDLPAEIELRRAGEADAMPVIRVLQGSLLEIDSSTVRRAVDRGDVLVAEADGWVVGALVLEDNHVESVAVRREYRKRGIGSALVETAAAALGGPVTAEFRAGVRGFWQDLDFEIEKEGDRFYGIRSG